MTMLRDVCRHVRSKNAGPFWITVDIFFSSEEHYRRYHQSPALQGALFERLYGADPQLVKHLPMEALTMLKISYPRPHPQGWIHERDMHAGQQYVRLLNVILD